ncbi:MAG: Gfo/Idh/MocA family oxidoreductase [Acidimicrobiales bacterium]|nr:Gfo/Idh/MocA family oxidoreductase [Acidimicrobiales bacterium]
MKQVVQGVSGGSVRVIDVPPPSADANEVLVKTLFSAISPGTERAVTQLAQSSYLQKAKARPDLVKQVIAKAKSDGPMATLSTVKSRLASDLPLGYSACGIVQIVGETVSHIKPGDLVATGGAGAANHAEFQAVPGLLCVKVPEGVEPQEASLATIGAIAMHGFRLTEVGPGAVVVVIGLGLIGQLSAQIAIASGARVVGIDVDQKRVDLVSKWGALGLLESGKETTDAILSFSRGIGADAVMLTAGGKSNSTIRRTPELCRDRATVVVVGDVSLDGERTPFYMKELTMKVARSYGPGRYERSYEQWGVDYPPGYVRWSEGRNIEAVLDLQASKKIDLNGVITHNFDIASAPEAYALVDSPGSGENVMSITLSYGSGALEPNQEKHSPINLKTAQPRSGSAKKKLTVGLIGSGAYAVSTLVPKLKDAGFGEITAVTSSSLISANRLVERLGSGRVAKDANEIIHDEDIDVVIVATPHESHAALVIKALDAKKHIWCEKPLALNLVDFKAITDAGQKSPESLLWVGFNRRFSHPVQEMSDFFGTHGSQLVVTYRVSAGQIPSTHWYNDRTQGGRLIGEVCHFIDTSQAIVKSPIQNITASGSSSNERVLADNLGVVLTFEDGSVASITYATGGSPITPKERVEVLGRGKTGLIDDFRSIELNEKRKAFRPQDKGQDKALAAFANAIRSESETPKWVFESSIAAILGAESLLSGNSISLQEYLRFSK